MCQACSAINLATVELRSAESSFRLSPASRELAKPIGDRIEGCEPNSRVEFRTLWTLRAEISTAAQCLMAGEVPGFSGVKSFSSRC